MISFLKRKKPAPVIRQRAEHIISRANIDEDALKVLYRLSKAGYTAYLVGGSVRDLLLKRQPKDFDVGTDAQPREIRRLFRNCFLIGKRFRLAHIIFGRKVIEASTFRRQPEENGTTELYQTEDNTFGTPEEDAYRRDFTVNGLFYDIQSFAVIDYVGGLEDLEARTLRAIGDPNVRFREDPVRMLRALKFASRLDFKIERLTSRAIRKHHAEILKASIPRLCEELFRLFPFGSGCAAFKLLWQFKLMDDLLPDLSAFIDQTGGARAELWGYLEALDRSPQSEQFSNGARLAVLYYSAFKRALAEEEQRVAPRRAACQKVAQELLQDVARRLHIPKNTIYTAVALYDSARRFVEPPRKGRSLRFLANPAAAETLAFQRLILEAEGLDTAILEQWCEAHRAQLAKAGPARTEARDKPRSGRRRGGRSARGRDRNKAEAAGSAAQKAAGQ